MAQPQIRGGYLNAYASVAEARAGIGSWLGFYNEERQHQSLAYRTPRQAYEAECRWICVRSASPTGCAFAHIPTGTTNNHRIDIDEREGRSDAMLPATQLMPSAPWQIPVAALETEAVKTGAREIGRRPKFYKRFQ